MRHRQGNVSNAWDGDIDVSFIDKGKFADGRYICETRINWLASVRAMRRDDGSVVSG